MDKQYTEKVNRNCEKLQHWYCLGRKTTRKLKKNNMNSSITKHGKIHKQLFYKKENGSVFPAIVRHFRKVEPFCCLSGHSLFLHI